MKKNLKYRLMFILAVVAGSVFLFYPPSQKINLGLDLRGGVHLVLKVATTDAVRAEANQVRDRVEADLRENGIVFSRTRVSDDFQVEILGLLQDQEEDWENYLTQYSANWTVRSRFREGEIDSVLSMNAAYRKVLIDQTVRQVRETISRRVDQYGVAEPTIVVYGSGDVKDQIIVELPGIEDAPRVINLIKSVALLELKITHPTQGGPYTSREAAIQSFNGALPPDFEVLEYQDTSETGGEEAYMVVRKAASITGQHLKNARRAEDAFSGRSEIEFFLNAEGVALFSRATEQNVGNRLAIVLDGKIRSAPNISEKITTESARITGTFSAVEAEDLALVLRSGALPAKITILENRTIGPSLGQDSIDRGVRASWVAVILVVIGMLIAYRFSGMNAVACLLLNLTILTAVLASFRATLTLPGIAGIILTIGMAVDANILIFERIKEELRVGKTVRSAVDAGFSRVFLTIIDTNLTTLVAALFLFQFGTGPIRGFAVTLAVGLIANIFTAVFVSKTLFGLILQKSNIEKLSI